ncbi:hypothetical protein AVEN_224074-1 [Araneus ventricosus]|uniref:DUF19 domain-containing protein n=1 Tax=Araneus ventricosus TaxID=182803 RepID=A0A4Y2IYT5_ARAVE|nr:hypothetical protein AVEN_224074-1 [Araneus ventricosus]
MGNVPLRPSNSATEKDSQRKDQNGYRAAERTSSTSPVPRSHINFNHTKTFSLRALQFQVRNPLSVGLFVSVHCDQKCIGAAVKECMMEPVPSERMRLCKGVKDEAECLSRMLRKCDTHIWIKALDLRGGFRVICDDIIKVWFDKERACYQKAILDSVCVEPIIEATGDLKTPEDFIRANKKVCNLFEPYSNCVQENVERNCNNTVVSLDLFNNLYNPLREFSNFLCEELILPADEKDSRPDSFGMINVYEAGVAIFESA